MSYTWSDVELSEDREARLIDIKDLLDNMSDREQAEWIDYILTQDKIVDGGTNVV